MKTRSVVFVLCLLLFGLLPLKATAENRTKGVVVETGFSGIILKGPDQVKVKYWTGRRTKYSPSDWRPMAGDKISVTFYQTVSRKGEKKLVASHLELVEAGARAGEIKSPASGKVIKVGRRSLLVEIYKIESAMRFERSRGTRYVPDGWRPAPGDKMRILFTRKPRRFGTGYVYVIDSLKKE
jgi:hypothetical protein